MDTTRLGTRHRWCWAVHRIGWGAAAGIAVALGLMSLLAVSVMTLAAVWTICAAMIWLVLLVPVMLQPVETGVTPSLRKAVRWGVPATASMGLSMHLGWLTLVPVVVLAASAPEVVRRLGRRRAPARDTASSAEESLAVTDGLTDADLCLAWRSSYTALVRAESPASWRRTVEIRGFVLDELVRRDPAAIEAWLRSGARVASGPERHLSGPGQQVR